MNILSLDTTADICSITLKTEQSTHVFHELRPREHAKIVLPEVQRLCEAASIQPNEFDYVVFGRGPGSFTGVRIATGIAQGLAFAAECPVVPVSTLQSLAYSVRTKTSSEIWVALDARMSEIYFARFKLNEVGLPMLVGEERVLPPSQITDGLPDDVLLVGNGWQTDYEFTSEVASVRDKKWVEPELPHSADSLALAQSLLAQKLIEKVAPEDAIPTYLRDKVTWDNKPKVGS